MSKGPVKFYDTGKDYDFLANTSPVGIDFDFNGKLLHINSTEALFQGLKYLDGRIPNPKTGETVQTLANSNSAVEAENFMTVQNVGSSLQRLGTNIWNTNWKKNRLYNNGNVSITANNQDANYNQLTVSEKLMEEILLIKATQNPQILKKLFEIQGTAYGSRFPNPASADSNFDPIQENAGVRDTFWGSGINGSGRNALGRAWMRVANTLRNELETTNNIQIRCGLSPQMCNILGCTSQEKGHNALNATFINQQPSTLRPF